MLDVLSLMGVKLIVSTLIIGGVIAFIADVVGRKIGRAHVRFLGLRPKHNARILTVISGMFIAFLSMAIMAATSESARTALFGMEKVREEIQLLEKERDMASAALVRAKKEMTSAKKKVGELNDVKDKLTGEVNKLEKNTQVLIEGIAAMREGEVAFRAGEVVYAAVMRGNLAHGENIIQMEWLLRSANEAVLKRFGLMPKNLEGRDSVPQALAIKKESMDSALLALDKAKNDKFFRVRTLTNVMTGEISPCSVEIFDNKLVYRSGTIVYREEYVLPKKLKNTESLMMDFLKKVNRISVEQGVISDPITGNVGGIDADSVLAVTSLLRKAGRHFVLEAKADGNIYSSGPVRLIFNVARIVEE